MTPSEGEAKAAKRERNTAAFGARSVHIATAALRTVGYSGPEVNAIVEKTVGPAPTAASKAGKEGAAAGKVAGKAGGEGAAAQGGAGKAQGMSTATTLADSDANAMGIPSDDEDAEGEGTGTVADAAAAAAAATDGDVGAPAAAAEAASEGVGMAGGAAADAADAVAAETDGAAGKAAAAITDGAGTEAASKTAAAAESGAAAAGAAAAGALKAEAPVQADAAPAGDVLATEAFAIADRDVAMKAETVGTMRNVRRLIYKTLYAHLSKSPYREIVAEDSGKDGGKEGGKETCTELVLSECPEVVLIERVHESFEVRSRCQRLQPQCSVLQL